MDADKLARLVSLQGALEAALGAQEQLKAEGLDLSTSDVTSLLERQLDGLNRAVSDLLGSGSLRVLGLTEVPSRKTLVERRDSMLEQYSPSRFQDLPVRYQELAASDRREVEDAFNELMAALYGPDAPGSAELDSLCEDDDLDADFDDEEEDVEPCPPPGNQREVVDSIVFLLEGKNRPLTVTELTQALGLSREVISSAALEDEQALAVPFWPYAETVGLPRWSDLLQRVATHSWEQLRTRLLGESLAFLGREQWLAILNEAQARGDRGMVERSQRFFGV